MKKKYICKFYATKWQQYHYFEIVYVKVIFLHVDLLLCVLIHCISFLGFFLTAVETKSHLNEIVRYENLNFMFLKNIKNKYDSLPCEPPSSYP